MHARIQAQGKELEQRDLLPQLWGAVNTVLRRQGADALELVWDGFVAKREVLAWLAAKMDATDNKPLLEQAPLHARPPPRPTSPAFAPAHEAHALRRTHARTRTRRAQLVQFGRLALRLATLARQPPPSQLREAVEALLERELQGSGVLLRAVEADYAALLRCQHPAETHAPLCLLELVADVLLLRGGGGGGGGGHAFDAGGGATERQPQEQPAKRQRCETSDWAVGVPPALQELMTSCGVGAPPGSHARGAPAEPRGRRCRRLLLLCVTIGRAAPLPAAAAKEAVRALLPQAERGGEEEEERATQLLSLLCLLALSEPLDAHAHDAAVGEGGGAAVDAERRGAEEWAAAWDVLMAAEEAGDDGGAGSGGGDDGRPHVGGGGGGGGGGIAARAGELRQRLLCRLLRAGVVPTAALDRALERLSHRAAADVGEEADGSALGHTLEVLSRSAEARQQLLLAMLSARPPQPLSDRAAERRAPALLLGATPRAVLAESELRRRANRPASPPPAAQGATPRAATTLRPAAVLGAALQPLQPLRAAALAADLRAGLVLAAAGAPPDCLQPLLRADEASAALAVDPCARGGLARSGGELLALEVGGLAPWGSGARERGGAMAALRLVLASEDSRPGGDAAACAALRPLLPYAQAEAELRQLDALVAQLDPAAASAAARGGGGGGADGSGALDGSGGRGVGHQSSGGEGGGEAPSAWLGVSRAAEAALGRTCRQLKELLQNHMGDVVGADPIQLGRLCLAARLLALPPPPAVAGAEGAQAGAEQRELASAVVAGATTSVRELGGCAHLQTLSLVPVLCLALLRCGTGSSGKELRRPLLRQLRERAVKELHVLLAKLVRLGEERRGGGGDGDGMDDDDGFAIDAQDTSNDVAVLGHWLTALHVLCGAERLEPGVLPSADASALLDRLVQIQLPTLQPALCLQLVSALSAHPDAPLLVRLAALVARVAERPRIDGPPAVSLCLGLGCTLMRAARTARAAEGGSQPAPLLAGACTELVDRALADAEDAPSGEAASAARAALELLELRAASVAATATGATAEEEARARTTARQVVALLLSRRADAHADTLRLQAWLLPLLPRVLALRPPADLQAELSEGVGVSKTALEARLGAALFACAALRGGAAAQPLVLLALCQSAPSMRTHEGALLPLLRTLCAPLGGLGALLRLHVAWLVERWVEAGKSLEAFPHHWLHEPAAGGSGAPTAALGAGGAQPPPPPPREQRRSALRAFLREHTHAAMAALAGAAAAGSASALQELGRNELLPDEVPRLIERHLPEIVGRWLPTRYATSRGAHEKRWDKLQPWLEAQLKAAGAGTDPHIQAGHGRPRRPFQPSPSVPPSVRRTQTTRGSPLRCARALTWTITSSPSSTAVATRWRAPKSAASQAARPTRLTA